MMRRRCHYWYHPASIAQFARGSIVTARGAPPWLRSLAREPLAPTSGWRLDQLSSAAAL